MTSISTLPTVEVQPTTITVSPQGEGILRCTVNGLPVYSWQPINSLIIPGWMVKKADAK